jgi:hypothetical protein
MHIHEYVNAAINASITAAQTIKKSLLTSVVIALTSPRLLDCMMCIDTFCIHNYQNMMPAGSNHIFRHSCFLR